MTDEEPVLPTVDKIAMRRHHRRARTASIAEYERLGIDHAREDALTCFAGAALVDPETERALQRQRMADRQRRLIEAGVSQDRITAWLEAHTAAFVKQVEQIARRSVSS